MCIATMIYNSLCVSLWERWFIWIWYNYDIWHIQFSLVWALREVQLLLRYDQLKIYAVCSCLSGTRTRKAEVGILTLMLSAATWYYSPPNPNPKPPWKWGNPLRLSNNLGGRFLMSFLQPTESWFCIAFGCTRLASACIVEVYWHNKLWPERKNM